jgi:hypothetical protein
MWRDTPDHIQSEVVTALLADWQRHRDMILEAWRSRTAHDLVIARRFHGDPAVPWAAMHFDEGDQSSPTQLTDKYSAGFWCTLS